MPSRALTRRSLSANALAVALGLAGTTTAAMGSTGCEILSGLGGLESVDCLGCDDASSGDTGSDAEVFDSPVFDSSPEASPKDSSSDVEGEPDVLGSDADEIDDAPRCESASDCGACTDVHSNGLGQEYVDCIPRGTYDLTQATEACAAYASGSSQCRAASCGAASVVCSSGGATSCACWGFAGAGAGHVQNSGLAGLLNCVCPGPTAPAWN